MGNASDIIKRMLDEASREMLGESVARAIVECRACKRKNRVKLERKGPRCGGCGLPLIFKLPDSVKGKP